MSTRRGSILCVLVLVMLLSPLLTGCGSSQTTVPPTSPPVATSAPSTQAPVATAVPPTAVPPTAVSPTATKPPAPAIGGTLVRAYGLEPDTLDPQKVTTDQAGFIQTYFGASLVALDPGTGKIVPYLATGWKVSDDGLTWEFALRKDVKFHDGSPFKAEDYVYTFTRALDPATKAIATKGLMGSLLSAKAVDDYTLQLQFAQPEAPFLVFLTNQAWMQPISKAAVERMGDVEFGRHPTGVGPYMVKEWVTGDHVTLERNPDYTWGPAFAQGKYYVQTLVYRFIGDYSTIVAGLEAGEIDWAEVRPKDLAKFKGGGKFQIDEVPIMGIEPFLPLNTTRAPLDDVRVRQALNLAVDRDALIKAVMLGAAVPQYGPLSVNTPGYWSGVEKIGYGFDLARAKALMKDSGYVVGSSGFLEKDGKALKLTLKFAPSNDTWSQLAQALQGQFKALGIDLAIQQVESASLGPQVRAGEFDMILHGLTYPDPSVMVYMFSSGFVGTALNASRVKNPDLDALLAASQSAMDPAKRQDLLAQAQKLVVEQAYIIPLYAGKTLYAVSNRVKGTVFSPSDQEMILWLDKAYIEGK
jgi:peptide/nickel transport system substrate-binding protein